MLRHLPGWPLIASVPVAFTLAVLAGSAWGPTPPPPPPSPTPAAPPSPTPPVPDAHAAGPHDLVVPGLMHAVAPTTPSRSPTSP
jgi:hypothetical protein